MRLRTLAALLVATLLPSLTGGEPALSQDDRYLHLQRGYGPNPYASRPASPYAAPQQPVYPRGGYYRPVPPTYAYPSRSYYPPVVPVYPEEMRRPTSPERRYQRRYYYDEEPREARRPAGPVEAARPEPRVAPERAAPDAAPRTARRNDEAEAVRPRKVRRAAPAIARGDRNEKPEEAEVRPSTTIVVFGDTLADLVGQGLDEAYEEAMDVEVVRKTRGDSGLVRQDHHDWPKVVQDYVNGGQQITFAVLMMGSNDRQSLREGDTSHDPLSDRWREIYRERVDATIKPLVDKKIPFMWVGAPPMRSEKASADTVALNEIYRERVQKAGGLYVDIWPGFVNDENKYAATGPSVDGQVTRLRTNDGVHFTGAGARKAAHFAEAELKRLIEQRNAGSAVATVPAAPPPSAPSPGGPAAAQPSTANVDQTISASLPNLPEPQGLPSLATKPVAGPVLPLTRPETSPGGTLATGRPRLEGDAAYSVERALRQGVAPSPRPGRADDFKWPRT